MKKKIVRFMLSMKVNNLIDDIEQVIMTWALVALLLLMLYAKYHYLPLYR